MPLTELAGYVKLSTWTVENSVDALRVGKPSAGPSGQFRALLRNSPLFDYPSRINGLHARWGSLDGLCPDCPGRIAAVVAGHPPSVQIHLTNRLQAIGAKAEIGDRSHSRGMGTVSSLLQDFTATLLF
jgi:hypothetical protein